MLQNRIELFAVELEEQKIRFVRVLALVAAAVFLANTAILVVTVTIVVVVGEAARVPVLIGLSLVYIVAALLAFRAVRNELKSSPAPFEGSISELKKDRQCVNPQD